MAARKTFRAARYLQLASFTFRNCAAPTSLLSKSRAYLPERTLSTTIGGGGITAASLSLEAPGTAEDCAGATFMTEPAEQPAPVQEPAPELQPLHPARPQP